MVFSTTTIHFKIRYLEHYQGMGGNNFTPHVQLLYMYLLRGAAVFRSYDAVCIVRDVCARLK